MLINYFVGIDTGHFRVCYRTLSPHGNGAVPARLQKEFEIKKSAELRKRVLQRQKKNQEKSDSVAFEVRLTHHAQKNK